MSDVSYALPQGWQLIDHTHEDLEFSGSIYRAYGLAAQNEHEQILTGSACLPICTDGTKIAYSELMERILTFETLAPSLATLPSNQRWRPALSNGVAIHTDAAMAATSATCELIERDLVLRSWYGEFTPTLLSAAPPYLQRPFDQEMETLLVLFESPNDPLAQTFHVAGLFAFPRPDCPHRRLPFVYGLGCANTLELAILKCQQEWIQRSIFLIDQPIEEQPTFSPTALYHQEYYLSEQRWGQVAKWLRGERPTTLPRLDLPAPVGPITKQTIAKWNDYVLVQATAPDRVGLMFGQEYPLFGQIVPPELAIHPIA